MLTNTRRALLGKSGPKPLNFNAELCTFTAGMAKRATDHCFDVGWMSQGGKGTSLSGDQVYCSRGDRIAGSFYSRIDANQGTLVFFINPEWDGDDGYGHKLLNVTGVLELTKISGNYLQMSIKDSGGTWRTSNLVDASSMVAGTWYCIVCSWDAYNTIDGTNYYRITLDNATTYGYTLLGSGTTNPTASIYMGFYSSGALHTTLDAQVIGPFISRRVLYDGTYGIDLHRGLDEIAAIWNSGNGEDPCRVTEGPFDWVLGVPMNQTAGLLSTGEGNAWSMIHSSNLLQGGLMPTFGPDQEWCVEFDASDTYASVTDGLAIQDLHDDAVTWEFYVRPDGYGEGEYGRIMHKGAALSIYIRSNGALTATVKCATTDASTTTGAGTFYADSKWKHVAVFYDDAGDREVHVAINGNWQPTDQAGDGLIVTDVGSDLIFGNNGAPGSRTWDGLFGWVRVSDNDRYNGTGEVDFTPSITPPTSDVNTVVMYHFDEGTGTTLDNEEGTAAYDATLSNGTWTRKVSMKGTPSTEPATLAQADTVFGNCGITWTADADAEGIKWSFTGLSAGANYALRGILDTDTSDAIRMRVTDDTNTADIVTYLSDVADRVANGDFSAVGNWTLGDGFSVAGGVLDCDGSQTGSTSSNLAVADQLNGGLVAGERYEVIYDVLNYTAGQCRIGVGTGANTTYRSANGTYTEEIVCVGTPVLYVKGDVDWDGQIDNLSVTPIPTREHPEEMLITFELPTISRNGVVADCIAITVAFEATANGQTVNFHQAELYPNIIDNPSMETFQGTTPDIPDGYTSNFATGECQASSDGGGKTHSGTDCLEIAAAAPSRVTVAPMSGYSIGDYFGIFAHVYGDGAYGPGLYVNAARLVRQSHTGSNATIYGSGASVWEQIGYVGRMHTFDQADIISNPDSTDVSYIDDFGCIALDPVSLTVTPRSEANSAEDGGICVDGGDTLVDTRDLSMYFTPTAGIAHWSWTPRHDAADFLKFGFTYPEIARFFFNTNNRITVFFGSAANTLKLRVDIGGVASNTSWNCTGAFVAGTTYRMRLVYTAADARLYIDDVLRITHIPAAGINFGANVPNIGYWGTDNLGISQVDAIYSPY